MITVIKAKDINSDKGHDYRFSNQHYSNKKDALLNLPERGILFYSIGFDSVDSKTIYEVFFINNNIVTCRQSYSLIVGQVVEHALVGAFDRFFRTGFYN